MNFSTTPTRAAGRIGPLAQLVPLALLALLLGAPLAQAEPTAIAQLPLLNISGSGTVKPNLMLLYDNSGSMNFNYTPDYINVTDTCRAGSTMSAGTRACKIGDPPFASAGFNRQYYDPAVRYVPPVKADGTSYPDLDAGRTGDWKRVPTDVYGVNKADFLGTRTDTSNLVDGFYDIEWCDGNMNNCVRNTGGYAYPTNARYRSRYVYSTPYYYTNNVAEYCTNTNLTDCRAATANGTSPASGYTVAARVRWCDSRALTKCQAKFVGNYKYPRFGAENVVAPWYGTITIGASNTASTRSIPEVTAVGPLGTQVITNSAVTAAAGTNTADKQAALAQALAVSINNKVGDADSYFACVRSPRNGAVPSCSSLGVALGADNVVGVVPVSCPANSTTKSLSVCSLVSDNSRAGTGLMVADGTGATALLRVSGTTNNSNNNRDRQVMSRLNFAGSGMLGGDITFNRSTGASAVVAALQARIGTRGNVTAYVGGTPNSSPVCANEPNTTLCLVESSGQAEGLGIDYTIPSNNTYSNRTWLTMSAVNAISDIVPTSATGLGGSVFVRTDIVPGRTIYPRAIGRTDCTSGSCSYAQEMTNFANWYGYYRTRNQMMKTAVGQAFSPVTDKYNVGLVALSVAAVEGAMNKPRPFAGADRNSWYDALYAMDTEGSTPVRQALHAIGKMYANQSPYNYAAGEEVVKFPCQQNFTFITTDGYWNGKAPLGVASNDEVNNPARFCLQSKGCVDPRGQGKPSLADIALYWYNGGSADKTVSLRPTLEDYTKPGAVPAGTGENNRLHMRTYALGLGVDGIMNYEAKYDTDPDPNGDFYKLVSGALNCPWNNQGRYVWPDPDVDEDSGSAALQSRVDDLWHAAINGHGKYFSASDPMQVVEGLRTALSNIEVKTGAAAAAATSTPNISQSDNDIFSATFTTVHWYGRLSKRKVNTITGDVAATEDWNTSSLLGRQVEVGDDGLDGRSIYMLKDGALATFSYDTMDTGTRAWFDNKCNALTQCANMSVANRALVNDGRNIVNWLRGRQQYANDNVLRAFSRQEVGTDKTTIPIVLGDIASSKPAYLREPRRNFDRPGYGAFKTTHASRKATVFAAANDGMLHAFDANSGEELWAYVPRITMKKLHQLASTTYGTNHIFSVDGSPEIADVQIGTEWKSVLVAGLNAGGRGYYALDVTDPAAPKALWELCADASACAGNVDTRLGLTFGNPQFGTIVDSAGVEKWVVFLTSGYNNIPGVDGVDGGDGKGYLLVVDVATGKVIESRSATTGVGSVATPSGLAKISAITNDPNNDPRVTYVYGGDNTGKMWRFDFTGAGTPARVLMGDAGVNQPVTTRPEVTLCRVDTTVDNKTVASAQRVVLFGTGRLLDLVDVTSTEVQSAYLLKDDGEGISTAAWRQSSAMVKRTLARVAGDDTGNAPYTIDGGDVNLASKKGWFTDFNLNTGERVNLDPQVVAGTINVVTNLPSSSTDCKVGGTSNIYQLNVCTGRAASPDGLAGYPLASSAAVGFIVIRLPSGALKTITTTADGTMVTGKFPPSETIEAHRAGWRRVRD